MTEHQSPIIHRLEQVIQRYEAGLYTKEDFIRVVREALGYLDAWCVEASKALTEQKMREIHPIYVFKVGEPEGIDKEIACAKCGCTLWSGGTDAKPRPWCNNCGEEQPDK